MREAVFSESAALEEKINFIEKSLTKNVTTNMSRNKSFVLHKLFFDRHKEFNFYHFCIVKNVIDLFTIIKENINRWTDQRKWIFLSLGLIGKNEGHQICAILTKFSFHALLIFDPNDEFYHFSDKKRFLTALKDL